MNFGLLGCGRIGRVHAATIAAHPGARLASCFDIAATAAEEVAASTGARVAGSIDAILADPDIAAVLIASATDTHIDLITRAAQAGKAVLCQRIEAFGAKGMLQAGNRHATTVEAWGAPATAARDPVQDFFIARYAEAYRAEIDHFIDCVETGTPRWRLRGRPRGAGAGRCGIVQRPHRPRGPAVTTIRLTAAQAVVRHLAAQRTEDGAALVAGCWAIFGHGNVAGLGEALHEARDVLPTFRSHNEQGMALAAIAFLPKPLRHGRRAGVHNRAGLSRSAYDAASSCRSRFGSSSPTRSSNFPMNPEKRNAIASVPASADNEGSRAG